MAQRQYHSLLTRDSASAPWGIAFGDYSKAVVQQELVDLIDSGEAKRSNSKIITTGSRQQDINAAVLQLNAAALAKELA